MNKPFQLLVFDWDGTLMDSEMHIVASMLQAIADLQIEPRSAAQISNIIGLGLREAIGALYPESDAAFAERMVDRYRYHYFRADGSAPFEGAEQTLRELSRQGYFLAVATGKGRRGLNEVLQTTGFGGYFHTTRCADETRSKPHPEMLEQIMYELGVEPSQTLMIGDTEYDLLMARNARAHGLGVSYGVHAVDRLLACNPLGCVDSVGQLVPWLAGYEQAPKIA